jgi:hypothetical protein
MFKTLNEKLCHYGIASVGLKKHIDGPFTFKLLPLRGLSIEIYYHYGIMIGGKCCIICGCQK